MRRVDGGQPRRRASASAHVLANRIDRHEGPDKTRFTWTHRSSVAEVGWTEPMLYAFLASYEKFLYTGRSCSSETVGAAFRQPSGCSRPLPVLRVLVLVVATVTGQGGGVGGGGRGEGGAVQCPLEPPFFSCTRVRTGLKGSACPEDDPATSTSRALARRPALRPQKSSPTGAPL